MKNLTLSSKTILIYRIIFAGLSWFTIIASAVIYTLTIGLSLELKNISAKLADFCIYLISG